MKNKNKILASLFLTVGVVSFFLINPTHESVQRVVKQQLKELNSPKDVITKEPSRSIASIPKATVVSKKRILNREVIGHVEDLKSIKFTNKVNKDWKKKYQSNFIKMLSGKTVKNLKIELKRSLVKVRGNIGTNLEHVIVSYLRPNGEPFSFEALINSETGTLVRSWNKSRYEYTNPVKINGAKYLYKE